MVKLTGQLEITRCPHCNVDSPTIIERGNIQSTTHDGKYQRFWKVYVCNRCGGAILAMSTQRDGDVYEIYPDAVSVHDSIPSPANDYLNQAINSHQAPSGAVMLCASSVDAMLKEKGYTEGSLHRRINEAKDNHLITNEMAEWAHEVRLDANEQRHADEGLPLPTEEDAKRSVEFTLALAEFLFILPAKVEQGRRARAQNEGTTNSDSAA